MNTVLDVSPDVIPDVITDVSPDVITDVFHIFHFIYYTKILRKSFKTLPTKKPPNLWKKKLGDLKKIKQTKNIRHMDMPNITKVYSKEFELLIGYTQRKTKGFKILIIFFLL
jgi:hypothetical protein